MTMRKLLSLGFSAALLSSSLAIVPHAHAEDALTSLSQKQEAMNGKIQKSLDRMTRNQQRGQQKLDALQKKYENASEARRAKLQKSIDAEKSKLQAQQDKINAYKEKYSPEAYKKKLENMNAEQKQKVQDELDQIKKNRDQNTQEIQKFRDQQKQNMDQMKKNAQDLKNTFRNPFGSQQPAQAPAAPAGQ